MRASICTHLRSNCEDPPLGGEHTRRHLLGARPHDALGLIVGQGLRLILAGVVAGVAMPFTIEEAKLKKLLKSAVAEVLQEQRDLVREAVMEAVEEVGLVRAIDEGAGSKSVSRDQIFRLLRKRR